MITKFEQFKESLNESSNENLNEKQLMKDISDDVIINIWKDANKKKLSHGEIMKSMSQVSGVSIQELESFLEKHKELIEEKESLPLDGAILEYHIEKSIDEEYQKSFQAVLEKFEVKSPFELEADKRKEFFDQLSSTPQE